MSIFAQRDGKPVIPRSLYLKILVFCCLVVISSIALHPIQIILSGAMNDVRNNFINNLEEETGIGIRYASIRPSFFGSFEIRNLKLYKEGRSLLTVSRARIQFSLLKLLLGDKTAVHTVLIERPVLRMDVQRDFDIFNKFLANDESETESDSLLKEETIILNTIAEYLPKNVNYKIQNGSLLFIDNIVVYKLEGLNVHIQGDGDDILFDSSFNSEIRYSGLSDRTLVFNLNVDIKSLGKTELHNINADIMLSNISCSEQKIVRGYPSFFNPVSTAERTSLTTLFTMRPVNISLSYFDKILYIDQMPPSTNIDYSFRYNLESGIITTHFNMKDFIPGSNIYFIESLNSINHLLNIAINGNFWFIRNANGSYNYSINYTGGDNSDGFIINAHGTDTNLKIDNFAIAASEKTFNAGLFQGSVSVSGNTGIAPLRPDLNILVKNFTLTGKEKMNGELDITSYENEIKLTGNKILMGDVVINNLSVDINAEEDDIFVLASLDCQNQSSAFIEAVIGRSPAEFDAIINMDSFSLYDITGILRPFVNFVSFPGFANGFFKSNKIDAEVFLTYDSKNIIYNAPNIVLRNKSTLGELSITGTDRQFNLTHCNIYFEDEILLITANTIVNNPMDFTFVLNASYQDVTWNVEGQILDRTTIIIRDPNGFHAYGNATNTGSFSGYIEGINYPIPNSPSLIYLNFYITLRYDSFDFWSVDVAYFEAKDINSDNEESVLNIAGSADQDGASFREIIINDSIGMLLGHADFSWDPDFSYLQFVINMTDGYADGENYNFEGLIQNDHLNINSKLTNMHINRFTKSKEPILASAEAYITWDSINSFMSEINVTEFKTNVNNSNINSSGKIYLTNDDVAVHDLILEYSDIKAEIPSFKINRIDGYADFQTNITGLVSGYDFEAEAIFSANFNRMNNWLDISQALSKFEGYLVFDKFKYGEILHHNVLFDFSGDNGAVSVLGGVDEMLRLEMDEYGNFYLGLSAPLPIRGSFAGTLSKELILDAHCNYFFIDMQSLWRVAADKDSVVGFGGGFITGKLDIRGPVLNPEFFGHGKGSSFNIKVPDYISEDIRPVPFNVIAQGYEMTFGPAVTVCGMGGAVTNGWFMFEKWVPRNIGIEVDVPRDTPIPYNIDVAGFVAEGDVSGTLSLLSLSSDNLTEVKGNLFMNNTEMGLNMDNISFEGGPFNENDGYVIADLKITTGPMVDFFWPNNIDPIIRANPEMGTVIYITSDTRAQQYSIKSDINIRAGELSYIDRNFRIRQGVLTLNESESGFNPIITARAEVRERVDSGPVTISLIVENQPLLSFEPRFETNPSLTQLELYSILGQNYNIQDSDNPEEVNRFLLTSTADIVTQVVARSDIFGQLIFTRQLERRAKDFFNLDMLSIRTRVYQNLLISGMEGAGIIGTVPDQRTSRIGNYFDNTTVSIGKYIGQDMFVQGTVTMKQDENSDFLGGLRIEPDIALEWQSPFVNIRWNFIPSSPQNWYVNDNSITLSWSKTF